MSAVIGPGVTGLLGPKGAGKTTLIRVIATLVTPDAGRLELLGHDPGEEAARLAIRRRLGYLPQEPGFHPAFTVFELVDYVAILKEMTNRRARHEEVRRVLSLVGLDDLRRRKIKTLSRSMRPRLGLAQALLGQPDLIVLDEPTAGLDPGERLRLHQVISAAAGQTVLLSTHRTDDVVALCSRVLVLRDGRVCFDGTPAELAGVAAGKVWYAPDRAPGARLALRAADGQHRHVGEPPPGVTPVAPTVDDGYLLLVGRKASEAAG